MIGKLRAGEIVLLECHSPSTCYAFGSVRKVPSVEFSLKLPRKVAAGFIISKNNLQSLIAVDPAKFVHSLTNSRKYLNKVFMETFIFMYKNIKYIFDFFI